MCLFSPLWDFSWLWAVTQCFILSWPAVNLRDVVLKYSCHCVRRHFCPKRPVKRRSADRLSQALLGPAHPCTTPRKRPATLDAVGTERVSHQFVCRSFGPTTDTGALWAYASPPSSSEDTAVSSSSSACKSVESPSSSELSSVEPPSPSSVATSERASPASESSASAVVD